MKDYIVTIAGRLVIALALCFVLQACSDDEFENETFNSNELRVLKVSEGARRLQNGATGVSPISLSLEIVFSTSVDLPAITNAVSVSNSATFSVSLDDTGSILTLSFQNLNYASEYTLTVNAGGHGAQGESLKESFSLSFTTSPFITPNVTLSTSANSVEEGGAFTITANLSETTTEDVVVTLSFGGSATVSSDFNVSATEITIPAFEQSASIEVATTDDTDVEGQEIIEISIANLVNGNDPGNQTVSFSIVDNDVATDLILKGVMAILWTTSGNNGGKAVHLKATANIPDLSVYSIGVANNGGGTDGIEFTLPNVSVAAGDDILLAREEATISNYFGTGISEFELIIETNSMNQNGDDAIELFSGPTVIETYGDANVDGTGEPWEYAGSWGYKLGDEWIYGGLDCAASSTNTQESDCTYPLFLNALQFQGVMSFEADPTGSGSTDRERAIHLRANRDITDLSVYGIGIANNGGGSDGREMDLPPISVKEGEHILFIRDEDVSSIATYFGGCFSKFDHTAEDSGINFNGDDGVELYEGSVVIEIYGDVVDDGTGLFWEYTGSWAFKSFGNKYTYGGPNCAEFAPNNASSSCPYPFCN